MARTYGNRPSLACLIWQLPLPYLPYMATDPPLLALYVRFEGNFAEYEEDRVKRMGDDEPRPLKYAKLAAL